MRPEVKLNSPGPRDRKGKKPVFEYIICRFFINCLMCKLGVWSGSKWDFLSVCTKYNSFTKKTFPALVLSYQYITDWIVVIFFFLFF